MRRFVEGVDRGQITLFPECLEDWIGADNPVRVVDVFVDELDLAGLGFSGVDPEATGRPSYHPSVLLKLYIYGYLNRVQSSRRLEREAGRNVEVMWLTGRLAPDHKTIADFRKDNGRAIREPGHRFRPLPFTNEGDYLAVERGLVIKWADETGLADTLTAEPGGSLCNRGVPPYVLSFLQVALLAAQPVGSRRPPEFLSGIPCRCLRLLDRGLLHL